MLTALRRRSGVSAASIKSGVREGPGGKWNDHEGVSQNLNDNVGQWGTVKSCGGI